MKHRMLALGLALCMMAGLAACGGNGGDVPPTPAPVESVSPAPEGTVEPTATPAPSDEVTATPAPSGDPVETPSPTPTPAIGDPTAPPSEEPSAEPSDTPSIAIPAASTVYDTVAQSSGGTTATMDASAVLETFYSVSAGDLEDFAFYMPELSAYTEEFFIARAKAGKVDSVKAACQSRLDGLKEEGATYPTAAVYLDSAKIVTEGDWVMLCICPDPSGAVSAFQNAVK